MATAEVVTREATVEVETATGTVGEETDAAEEADTVFECRRGIVKCLSTPPHPPM